MKIYSCETHIDQALDDFIEKEEVFPVMNMLVSTEELSTSCTYCKKSAIYIVANE